MLGASGESDSEAKGNQVRAGSKSPRNDPLRQHASSFGSDVPETVAGTDLQLQEPKTEFLKKPNSAYQTYLALSNSYAEKTPEELETLLGGLKALSKNMEDHSHGVGEAERADLNADFDLLDCATAIVARLHYASTSTSDLDAGVDAWDKVLVGLQAESASGGPSGGGKSPPHGWIR